MTVIRSVTSGTTISFVVQGIAGDCDVYVDRRDCVMAFVMASRVILGC